MIIDGYILQILDGVKITFYVAMSSIFIGVIIGILGGWLELSKIKIVRNITMLITSTIRGLPELLIIFAVYFGGTIVLKKVLHINTEIPSFIAGVVALGCIFGAYATQVFRGAILMINNGQRESSWALGLKRFDTFRFILFPQIFRYSLPGLSNLCLVTLKDSSLVALIGLQDLTFKAQLVANESYKPFTYYMFCALIYLMLTSIFEIVFKLLNRSNKYGF